MRNFYDEFGPERIFEVYDQRSGMWGVVVIHNTARGPGKGGMRFVPDITTEEVYGLAQAMTWKNASGRDAAERMVDRLLLQIYNENRT